MTEQCDHPVYAVGDPDPTPAAGPFCAAELPTILDVFCCTWPPDHDHPQHVAGDDYSVLRVWPVEASAPVASRGGQCDDTTDHPCDHPATVAAVQQQRAVKAWTQVIESLRSLVELMEAAKLDRHEFLRVAATEERRRVLGPKAVEREGRVYRIDSTEPREVR